MKIRFFSTSQPEARKNNLRISLITHDLDPAYTLPTPQNSLCTRSYGLIAKRRSKRHDA
jgi:hypothetical protein